MVAMDDATHRMVMKVVVSYVVGNIAISVEVVDIVIKEVTQVNV